MSRATVIYLIVFVARTLDCRCTDQGAIMAALLAFLRMVRIGLLAVLAWIIGLPRLLLKAWLILFSLLLTIAVLVFLVEVLWVSPRNIAYRYVAPDATNHPNACDWQQNNPSILATYRNSEDSAQRAGKGQAGLECMLQYHVVPSEPSSLWYNSDRPIGPIGYYLSFLEFQESGRFAERGIDGTVLARSQLEILEEHLGKQKNNYVLVFIHGWRHDARIGDDNVANARVYAAHAASALDYRCKTTGKNCDYTVTAVFVGWRGARVDEPAIGAFADRNLGFLGRRVTKLFKTLVGDFPALLTLFDRKPISERIAPSVIASLRHVDLRLKKRNTEMAKSDRLMVLGHSLGGNILATGLNSAMIEQIRSHKPGEILQSPLGSLVVMLNPAAEAWKWTSIQHEMRRHVRFPENTTEADADAKADAAFFPPNQPPVYISITSAFAWPSAALTQLEVGNKTDDDASRSLPRYDSATHDAFPFFKGNFQPLSETLDRLAIWFPVSEREQGTFPDKETVCGTRKTIADACVKLIVRALKFSAGLVRNVPFTSSVSDDTLTIGHMDPVRPPYSSFKQSTWQSPLPFGTTSELVTNNYVGHPTLYSNAGSAYLSECAVVDHWLWKARHNASLAPFEGWDSGYSHIQAGKVVPDKDTPNVTPIRPRPTDNGHLEFQLTQYLSRSGIQSIITSNDPMWNIRAGDSALAFHDGYVKYPLICALNQLVMDDVASEPRK
jgi:hypothetical protein